MTTRPRRCPICLRRRAQNDEDVLPIWLRNLLLELAFATRFQAPPRLKLRICQACNSQLGTIFENSAAKVLSPMIRAQNTALTPDQQQLLSGWIIKTSILLVFHNERLGTGPTERERREQLRAILVAMMETGVPLEGVAVHVAARTNHLLHPATAGPPFADGWPTGKLIFSDMPALGPFVSRSVIGDSPDIKQFIDYAESDDWFVRIWPRQERTVQWPPARLLSQTDYGSQNYAWGHWSGQVLMMRRPDQRPKPPKTH